MKIIISPAKKMKEQQDVIENLSTPIFEDKAKEISCFLGKLKYPQLKELLACNDQLATLNFERYENMDFQNSTTPAILSYDGIQYKYMAPAVFENEYFSYVQNHLRILSGLYGVLKPLDKVLPYRLEMQAKLQIDGCKNLYEYWGDSIYNAEFTNEDVILNLASSEYSKVVEKHIAKNNRFIDVIFGEISNGKIIEKGVYVKMARGEMVRFMAENNIADAEQIKEFTRLGYQFSKEHSKEDKFIFIKENKR